MTVQPLAAPTHQTSTRAAFEVDVRSILFVVGVAAYYVWAPINGAAPWRASCLGSILIEVGAWTFCAFLVATRRTGVRLRVSDPGFLFLGWVLYFYIDPAVRWVTGETHYDPWFDSIVTPEQFVRVQYLQTIFILSFVAVYRALAPAVIFSPQSRERLIQHLPRARWLLLVGLFPLVVEAGRRLVQGGTLAPTSSYGDSVHGLSTELEGAGRAGGSELLVLQMSLRLAMIPIISLGAAFGLAFAKLIRERRWWLFLACHLAFPVLLYLGQGARSSIMSVYVVAVILADALAGPLPWTYVLSTILMGGLLSTGFAAYRIYQDQGFAVALQNMIKGLGDETYTSGDGAIMIVKEAFTVNVVDRSGTGTTEGPIYFLQQAASLLPRQLVPEKAQWFHLGDFLSHEFLGPDADRGEGVAGAMVGDGYWIGHETGVVMLAAILAVVVGLLVRVCIRGTRGRSAPLWLLVLLAGFMSRTFFLLRGDFGIVLSEILWDIAIPALAVFLVLERYPASRWRGLLQGLSG
jgi:hypothetical protein